MLRYKRAWIPVLLGILFVLLVTIPYVLAYQSSGVAHQFGGYLLNPIDGNSYLAKMYQGWQGKWRFQLPYTVEPGEGGYLFLFYLALGQMARVSGSNLQLMFHSARIGSVLALIFSLWYFYGKVFDSRRTRGLAFAFALFGSGVGWLASFFGIFSADFWVAEGFPFLAAYANPHFPLGLAILLLILAPPLEKDEHLAGRQMNISRLLIVGAGFLLALILPFGIVIAGVVLAGLVVWEIWDEFNKISSVKGLMQDAVNGMRKSRSAQKLILLLLGGMPVLIYQLWVILSDPVLANWNAQNLTPSPPFWDVLLSYSPLIFIAIVGAVLTAREKTVSTRILLLWAGSGLVLLYIPWGLQRRFMLGYMIPIAGLAAFGLDRLISRRRTLAIAVICLVLIMIIPTNLIIILGGFQAIQSKDEKIYLTQDEYQGLGWIEANTNEDAVILASPEMGLYIPAYTGRKVFYGHPFETADAVQMERALLNYFSGLDEGNIEQSIQGADYLFYGEREGQLGEVNLSPAYKTVFEAGDVKIYQIKDQ